MSYVAFILRLGAGRNIGEWCSYFRILSPRKRDLGLYGGLRQFELGRRLSGDVRRILA
jgi:hypothetical protein